MFVIMLIVGFVAASAFIVIPGLLKAAAVALILFGTAGWIIFQLSVADQQASGVMGLGVGGVAGAIIGGFMKSKRAG